jgi:hypothetical protein
MRVAIGANVLMAQRPPEAITGIVCPRWAYAVLRHALRGDFALVLSPLVITEPRHRITTTFPAFLALYKHSCHQPPQSAN